MTTHPSPDICLSINKTLSSAAKKEIINICWALNLTQDDYDKKAEAYKVYFDHWQLVCQKETPANYTKDLLHWDLIAAFQAIRTKPILDCVNALEQIYDAFGPQFPRNPKTKKKFVETWICLAGKVVLLLDLGNWIQHKSDNQTLHSHLSTHEFPASKLKDRYRIPRSFNLRNLDEIGGLKIRWTDLLSEHLALENDNTQVAIFHNVGILETLQASSDKVYPLDLITEVQKLHHLLLPRSERKAAVWFKTQLQRPAKRQKGSSTTIDTKFGTTVHLSPAMRDIDEFPLYKDRLVALKEEYDNHEPSTVRQYFIDTRRPSRQWGFLIAILVFIFGAAQTATGIVQCYKNYHPSPTPN